MPTPLDNSLPFIYAEYRMESALAIPNNADTVPAWDTIFFDNTGITTAPPNALGFTIQVAGLYHVEARVAWQGNANGKRELSIGISSLNPIAATFDTPNATEVTYQLVSADIYLISGVEIDTTVFQNRGGDLNIVANGTTAGSAFSIRLVGLMEP